MNIRTMGSSSVEAAEHPRGAAPTLSAPAVRVTVVERKRRVPAFGHGLGVAAGRLLLHRGERADCNHDAAGLAPLWQEEIADYRLSFARKYKLGFACAFHNPKAPFSRHHSSVRGVMLLSPFTSRNTLWTFTQNRGRRRLELLRDWVEVVAGAGRSP